MLRKNRHLSEKCDNENRWLITYADMLTLLMVFFVVMYSIAEIKASKLKSISFALNNNLKTKENTAEKKPDPQITKKETIKEHINSNNTISPLLNELGNLLKKKLKEEKISEAVYIEINNTELTISLNTDKGFFKRGSAEISPVTSSTLNIIASICRDMPENTTIRVEGHTCDLPIYSDKYPSNWELSTTRAINIAKYLIEECKLKADIFSVAGYGQYHPKYPNTSESNRAKNRRVDITLVLQEKK